MEKVSGVLDHFLIEPLLPARSRHDEFYICIQQQEARQTRSCSTTRAAWTSGDVESEGRPPQRAAGRAAAADRGGDRLEAKLLRAGALTRRSGARLASLHHVAVQVSTCSCTTPIWRSTR